MEEDLKVTVEEQSAVKRKIEIEVAAAEVDQCFDKTMKEYRREAVLPGFRKGKVPMSVIESRYAADVSEDVTREIVSDSYSRALKKSGLKPVSEPTVGELKAEKGKPLNYTVEVEVQPQFEVGNYLGIAVEGEDVAVADEEVQGVLEEMRTGQATLVKVEEDRGLRTDDVAMIDFDGKVEGEAFPGGSASDFPLPIGGKSFLPGFEDSLIGAKAGEERDFFLRLPEDFHEKELAGKEASFSVKVKELRSRVLPDLDDELAKDAGDFKSLDELRERIRNNIQASKEIASRDAIREKVIDSVIEATPFEVPSSMVQRRRQIMLENVQRNLMMRGVPAEELEKNREKIYEDTIAPAERNTRKALILEAIAEKEKIEVSDEDLQGEIRKIAEQSKMDPGEARRRLVANDSLDELKDSIRDAKTVDFLVEKAHITGAPPKVKDSAAEEGEKKE